MIEAAAPHFLISVEEMEIEIEIDWINVSKLKDDALSLAALLLRDSASAAHHRATELSG